MHLQVDKAVLQLHMVINLLRHGPVGQGVQVLERRPTVHRVLLLVLVQETGASYAVPYYNEGAAWELPVGRRPARH